MENKYLVIVLVAIAAIIVVAVGLFATGMLNGDSSAPTTTTDFKTDFMEGTFVGNVTLQDDSQAFMHSYKDKKNHIGYNISTVDDSDALMDIYYVQGVMNPEHRTINGNDWNIYFAEAVQGNDTQNANGAMRIIICQSQAEKQGYLIYVIIDSKSKVNGTNIYGEAYTDYIEPLLESVTLKESSNVPKIYEEFGLTESEFNQQMDLIKEYKAGNLDALEGTG